MAATGEPLAVADAQADPRHARDLAERVGYRPTTVLAVPVLDAAGATIGVLELLDRIGAPTYGLADMELLGHFAELVSLALERRRRAELGAPPVLRALARLPDLPEEARRSMEATGAVLTARLASDPAAREAGELAELVGSLAGRGAPERRLCAGILRAVLAYLDERPSTVAVDPPW